MKNKINITQIICFAKKNEKSIKNSRIIVFILLIQIIFVIIYFFGVLKKQIHYVYDYTDFEIYNEVVKQGEDSLYINDNDITDVEELIFGINTIGLPQGAYELKVNYKSVVRSDIEGIYKKTGIIKLSSEVCPSSLYDNYMNLYEENEQGIFKFWIKPVIGIEDLSVNVYANSDGYLSVKNIEITEILAYRYIKLLAYILLFVFVDVLFYFFFLQDKYNNKGTVAGILAIVLFSSLPVFVDFTYRGHDLMFHFNRIYSLADSIKNGDWNPRIQPKVLNGYGYVTPLFYSQLFLYIPALLYNAGLPLHICYAVFVVTINTITCLISYFCIKGIVKKDYIALTGSFLYTISIYRLIDIYVRAAVGEYVAITFLLLTLYGFYKVYTIEENEKIRLKDYLPIVFGLTGIIESHILSCEISIVFIFLICVVLYKKTFKKHRFLALCKAAALTGLLNLGFLIPLIESMKMDIAVKTVNNRIQYNGLYPIQLFNFFASSKGSSFKYTSGDMQMTIGFSLICGLILCMVCYSNRKKWNIKKSNIYYLGIISILLTILCLYFSSIYFPWDSIELISKKLSHIACMIQFPWRFLAFAALFSCIATVIGIQYFDEIKGKKISIIICGILVAMTMIYTSLFYRDVADTTETMTIYSESDLNINEVGQGEYIQRYTNFYVIFSKEIIKLNDNIEIKEYYSDNGITQIYCINNNNETSYIDIPVFNYDNYNAYDKNNERITIINGSNNTIRLVIPSEYDGMITVRYEVPKLWIISEVFSIITFFGIILVEIIEMRKNKNKVKSVV